MTFENPLDLQNLLVSTLAGSWTTFLFIALIFLTMLAARFRMNNITFFMLAGLFGVLLASWIPWFYAAVVVIGSIGIFFVISKVVKN